MLRFLSFVAVGVSLGWMWDVLFTPPKPQEPGDTRFLSLSEPPKSIETLFAECRRDNNVPVIGPGSTVVCLKRTVVVWEH